MKNNRRLQPKIATDRYQQEALTKYFEQMSQLLLDKNLRKEGSEARTIARARTLSTLNQLNNSDDNSRNDYMRRLMEFLVEAELIDKEKPIISLEKADFDYADLLGANLNGANLGNTHLVGAILQEANLSKANLLDALFYDANLRYADLSRAGLSGANMRELFPSGKKLDVGTLKFLDHVKKDANLFGANLSGAKLPDAENFSNQQIKSACFWEKAIYIDAKWNQTEERWIPVDEKANQNKIEEIRKDETSNPKNTPNCDGWGSRSEL
jgi:uncharacterized protein YjbI with pentapeptide repeats